MSNFKGIFVSLQHIRVYKDYLISTIVDDSLNSLLTSVSIRTI